MREIREILVLHHSHLDVGYTHSQPIAWEMQREYIDLALDLLERTEDWPDHSRPKWTCEVTEPVTRWLRTAAETDMARFNAFLRKGRMGISAMQYNTTPLCSAEQLSRQLAPVRALRERFGIRLNTLNQHDVNGVAWPLADLMIDCGIELLTMAVNICYGHFVIPRPGVFRWAAPSGREILVMNGSHYTMFDQLLYAWDDSLPKMREGLAELLGHLEKIGYPHDFIYLTTTNAPEAWDNSPPNPQVARLIRTWNEEGEQPAIRYVTPEDLLARVRQIPPESLPVLRGDWTDYWCFGSASAAHETAVSRRAQSALSAAELLQASRSSAPSPAVHEVSERAWSALTLFSEHTWTYWDTSPGMPPARTQSELKAAIAHEARELAHYLLVDQLEDSAGNTPQSAAHDHVLVVNPTGLARRCSVRIPDSWRKPGKRLRCERFTWLHGTEGREPGVPCGPVDLPPFGWRKLPLAALQPADPEAGLLMEDRRYEEPVRAFNNVRLDVAVKGVAFIESPFHRLSFDPLTGRILGLLDKGLGWEVLAPRAEYAFFEYVRERPDALVDGRREAIYDRDLEKEKFDQPCWKTDWRAVRERAMRPLSCRAEREPDSVSRSRS